MISAKSAFYVSVSDALSKSVEETFRDILGEHAKNALLSYLARQGIRWEQFPESIQKFETILEEQTGRAGPIIEKQIAKRLYRELGLEPFENPHLSLSDYVEIAKQRTGDSRTRGQK